MSGLDHVYSVIRITVIDVELTVVIPDSGRPNAVTVLRVGKDVARDLCLKHVRDNAPVNEISRMKNRKAWDGIETGSGQIEISTDTNNVRVRIVCMDDRILVSTVTVI